jgi:transposase
MSTQEKIQKRRHTWTLAILASWIERQFGQSFTEKGVSNLLKRLG